MARMQDETVSRAFEHFVGTDLSKAHLDLAVWSPAGQGGPVRRGKTRLVAQRFGNDPAGIAALLAGLGAPHLVVIEPTGRYRYALWAALAGAGHGAAPINPYRARCLTAVWPPARSEAAGNWPRPMRSRRCSGRDRRHRPTGGAGSPQRNSVADQ